MALIIERRKTRKRAGSGKKGNPHMEGQINPYFKKGKWNPKTKRYDPAVLDPEKRIVDKKKPYRKPKKPTGKPRGTGPRGMKGRKKK